MHTDYCLVCDAHRTYVADVCVDDDSHPHTYLFMLAHARCFLELRALACAGLRYREFEGGRLGANDD